MNNMLSLFSMLLLAVMALLTGCQRNDSVSPKDALSTQRVIAMVQLTEVDRNTVAGFKEAMSKLGYEEGKNVTYLEVLPAGSTEKLDGIIRNQLEKKPNLFLASSTPATLAVKRLTEAEQKPPVVFAPVNDPLGAGIVADLKHPGGHITGIRLPTGDDLRMQWLTRLVPGAKRVFLPYSADDKSAQTSMQQADTAAVQLGIKLYKYPISSGETVGHAITAMPTDVDAIFLPRDSRLEAAIEDWIASAKTRGIPISGPSQAQVIAGALFSYGFVHRDIGRQAARLADQILRGTAAGDLPVEMAENSLSINLATAQRLGIKISNDILIQADQVIRE